MSAREVVFNASYQSYQAVYLYMFAAAHVNTHTTALQHGGLLVTLVTCSQPILEVQGRPTLPPGYWLHTIYVWCL